MTLLRFLAIASLMAIIGCGGAGTGGGGATPAPEKDTTKTTNDDSAAITPEGEQFVKVSFQVSPAMT